MTDLATRPPNHATAARLTAQPFFDWLPTRGLELHEASSITGIDIRAVSKRGSIDYAIADRIAVRLGTHPSRIWGDEWWSIPPESCRRGHERTEANTLRLPDGTRACRDCRREVDARRPPKRDRQPRGVT